ncbi:hypothetical protein HID58_084406, partial [Brassica napus]
MDRHPAPTTAPSVLTALLRFVVLSPPEEGSKSTTIDDSLCPDGVYSVCSCLLPHKNDLKPPQSTTLSVLIVSLPSSLVFFRSLWRLLRRVSSVGLSALAHDVFSLEITSREWLLNLVVEDDVKRLTLYELSTAKHFFRLSNMDSTNPYTQPFNFVDLLHSQQDSVPFPY